MSILARPQISPRLRVPVAVGGTSALAVLVVLVALLAGGGSGEPGPQTGAAALIPADALAYVNVSIDPNRPAVRRGLALAARFPSYPLLSALVQTRLGGLAGSSAPADFARDVRPWLGREAALALLNTQGRTAGSLIVIEVRDRVRAQAFLSRAGASVAGAYRGTELRRNPSGTELAFVSRYLVLGQDASVRAAIDTAAGTSASLATNSTYLHASAGEPSDRVLDAYLSAAGVRRALVPQGGVVGALGALLYQPSLRGLTVSLSPTATRLRMRVHSALDPMLASLSGAGRAQFTPTLAQVVPSQSMLMLDVTGLDKLAPRVLNAGAAGGLAGRIGPLLSRLGAALAAEGVNVADLVAVFHGESVLAITPSAPQNPSAAAVRRPALTIVARTDDEGRTRAELAQLELPLEQLFPPAGSGPGSAPVFNDRQVGGTTVHQLALAPGLEFDYAVTKGLVILSTSLGAAAEVAAHGRSLVDDPAYRKGFATRPNPVTSLLFLDFSQLLRLGEQTGLTAGARYHALAADLQRIRTVGLVSTSGEADSTAELFLQIS